MERRALIKSILAMLGFAGPLRTWAQNAEPHSEDFQKLLDSHTQGAKIEMGKIQLTIPRLADNGHSVPLKISVDSPMTQRDHVKTLLILSPRNPRPLVAKMFFSPRGTQLNVSTRVRLNGSQSVWVYVQMSDLTWYGQSAEVEVTESACLDAS
jgi:sulfur-oxidizing protein SoxY